MKKSIQVGASVRRVLWDFESNGIAVPVGSIGTVTAFHPNSDIENWNQEIRVRFFESAFKERSFAFEYDLEVVEENPTSLLEIAALVKTFKTVRRFKGNININNDRPKIDNIFPYKDEIYLPDDIKLTYLPQNNLQIFYKITANGKVDVVGSLEEAENNRTLLKMKP